MINQSTEINKFQDASMFLNCGLDVFWRQLLESEICFAHMFLEKTARVLETKDVFC